MLTEGHKYDLTHEKYTISIYRKTKYYKYDSSDCNIQVNSILSDSRIYLEE